LAFDVLINNHSQALTIETDKLRSFIFHKLPIFLRNFVFIEKPSYKY